jgi:organic radical activating enzyme
VNYAVKEIFYTLQGERSADWSALGILAICRAHPQWQLSLQTHKLAGFR